jgi:hypothetical protein
MTRLDRIIKAFNDYDRLIKSDMLSAEEWYKIAQLRRDVRLLIEELKEHGCRRES